MTRSSSTMAATMDSIRPPRRTLRRIGAVLAGLAAVIVLSTATDVAMHASGVFPGWGKPMADALFLLALAYRAVYAVAGGYVTARLAPERPMWHAMALCAVGVAIGTAGTVATWNAGPEFGAHWYAISVVVLSIPCTWLGAKLHIWSKS